MKKITLLVVSLFLVVGAMAQFDTSKEYRIKDISSNKFLNAATYLENPSGTNGGVNLANKSNSEDQIFVFEASGSNYYLKTKSGYYIYCQSWNVDALEKKTLLTFEDAGNGYYYIKNGNKYFKVEAVSGTYYPFCDAELNKAAKWEITEKTDDEEIGDGESTYDPLADNSIYDYSGFTDENLLQLFYKAMQKGRKYPTMDEFEAAGIQASDIAFTRSHVRRAQIMSREDRLINDTYEKRDLFLNFPIDFGKDGSIGQPSAKFHADVFSMWQYTNLFGSWNKGIFQAPASWIDAAHRNGTDIMSGIKFFESWTPGSGDGAYSALICKKDENNNFIYVKPLIHCLMFFGADGINYNWEDDSYGNADIVAFHKALYKYAEEVGFDNYHSAIYTSQQGLTGSNLEALYGSKDKGKTHDLMLNYSGGDFTPWTQMQSSVNTALNNMGTTEGLYTGVWIASMDRSWSFLARNETIKKISICLWGEHGQSRFWQFTQGNGTYDTQANYQKLYERAMSGGNRNPANRPPVNDTGNNWEKEGTKLPLSSFAGLATWIPERSAIQGDLHFLTHFTLGNGDRYYYKGKMSHPGGWYNMGSQDLVPTYRWLRYVSNTTTVSNDIDVSYTHLDAYTGGSCIELTGASTANGTDIILYKTSLKAGNGAYAKLAVKTLNDVNTSDLYLILKKKGSDAWLEYPYGNISGKNWEEKKFNLAGIAAGDVVERIGLRVKGNNNNYQLYVGKLELNDNTLITPAELKNLWVEVKQETKSSMTMKLHWDVNATAKTRADWGLVYNDEANIDHFEILYKNGEDGKVAIVGKTSSWATTIGNFDFESVNDEPYIGVRSVSKDLKSYSPIMWQKVPRAPQSVLPDKEEENSYGKTMLDIYSEGLESALANRYLTEVKTTGAEQNLNYTANAPVPDGTNYANATDHVLKVRQGQKINLYLKAYDHSDGLKWCSYRAWMDFNGSGDFDHSAGLDEDELSERVVNIYFKEGSDQRIQDGYATEITIPEDATPGKSLLRIVFADSWFLATLNPSGATAKGFSIDFSVEIEGTNPGRVSVDYRDQGEAEEPEGVNGNESSVENVASEVSAAEGIEGAIEFANVEKAWIYTVDGKFVNFVKNPSTIAAEAGVYLVKMQNGNVIRSAKVLVK